MTEDKPIGGFIKSEPVNKELLNATIRVAKGKQKYDEEQRKKRDPHYQKTGRLGGR